MNFFLGIKKIAEVDSPINGKIEVIKGLAFGTYVQVANLTQSGGVLYEIWDSTLKKVARSKKQVSSVLILGLGGGSVAKIALKYWKAAQITGVDIDPLMVEMGKKYLGFDDTKTRVVIADAGKFVTNEIKKKHKYDLILVDMYLGDTLPPQFDTDAFIKQTKMLMDKEGLIVYNRLFYGDKRKEAVKFMERCAKIFTKVSPIYPEANVMYVCR